MFSNNFALRGCLNASNTVSFSFYIIIAIMRVCTSSYKSHLCDLLSSFLSKKSNAKKAIYFKRLLNLYYHPHHHHHHHWELKRKSFWRRRKWDHFPFNIPRRYRIYIAILSLLWQRRVPRKFGQNHYPKNAKFSLPVDLLKHSIIITTTTFIMVTTIVLTNTVYSPWRLTKPKTCFHVDNCHVLIFTNVKQGASFCDG